MHNHREKNIKVALFLNVSFTIIEIIGGILTNSLAILSDALHDFGDSIALATSWIAEGWSKKAPDYKRTFGYQRLSLFSALFAALVLIVGSLFILSKTIPRIINPEHVNAQGMIWLAFIGIIFNGLGFIRLKKGQSSNERVLSWHLLEDVLGWVVILFGAIIIQFWDNHIIDPLITIGFTVFILFGVAKELRETLNIFLQGVPKHIDIKKVKSRLINLNGVIDVHDIHIWSLEGETDVLTAHVVVEDKLLNSPNDIRERIKKALKEYHIEHSTIELEGKNFCSGIECGNDLK